MHFQKNRANITNVVRVVRSTRGLNIDLAELCKGSTNDSDSFCLGSNPSSAARSDSKESDFFVSKKVRLCKARPVCYNIIMLFENSYGETL